MICLFSYDDQEPRGLGLRKGRCACVCVSRVVCEREEGGKEERDCGMQGRNHAVTFSRLLSKGKI